MILVVNNVRGRKLDKNVSYAQQVQNPNSYLIKNFFKNHWIFILILIAILVFSIYSYSSQGVVYSLIKSDSQGIIDFVDSFGFFAALIFVLLVILEAVLAPVPPLVLYVAGGFLFGAFFGGILTLFGNLIGAIIAFKIARTFGRNFVEKRVDAKKRKKFDNFSEKHGALAIFILRLNPFTSSDLFSYLAGLTKIKVRSFLIATGLGLIPLIFLQTYIGETLLKNNPLLSLILIILSAVYLLVFIYLIFKSTKK